ncbi:ABC transporter permease [Mobilitalea sibirica]|uniref:ABC transporter permease n=1 Tax=Mobilitalea sibirica TaxID=1462919 RepID=A0A8J7H3G0_9FIRM|nr:ABC transporter permease [Mobilitalea sibirica]MBH1941623.1 ABC transporter permease [Mobilitalea sibirica]
MLTILLGILEEGLVYGIMALGVYITYKILDFPDLSVDGTFPLGGAVTAILIVSGVNPVLTLVISFFAGAVAGVITGLIHVKLKVRDLLSGIIMMTALYSINLRIAGRANLSIFSKESIFENFVWDKLIPDFFSPYLVVSLLFFIIVIMKLLLDLYLKTRSGYLLRAVGDNEALVTSLAKDKGTVKILGLAIANALVALAGSIYAQMSGFFEISLGTGTIVIGLASVIIGTNIFKRFTYFKATTAVIIGAILYKACVSFAISLGMEASDLKLITATLFLVILIVSNERKRRVKGNA